MECAAEAVAEQCPMASSSLDSRPLFQTLYNLVDSNVAFFQDGTSDTGRRFLASFLAIREHAQHLEPVLSHFATIFHIFDLDEHTPANGYRSLAHIVHCCLAHIIHKSHYVATNRHSIFFRASHNCAELEAYCSALTQLRALVYLAQSLLTHNRPGYLFSNEGDPLSEQLVQEYVTMHKGCFYGRCMGFQFAPSIRPFLQTIAIGLVSFGENYKRHVSGIGVMACSIFTSGKFVIDPELRGLAFERTTQNLDVHFWKSFWNLAEMELLVSLASMGSSQVRLSRPLLVPPHSFELPLDADPRLTVTITPPVAHSGPGAVQMRLISHELREGQDSEELNNLLRPEVTLALELRWKTKVLPRSPYLVVHFHGGGFVAQTSKSHEPYLKIWAQELGAPILSIDYSLSPEAPFPRALEECFYAYCWALRNCHLLGSTAERVCLAGDSAGGNLCITVSMRAAAVGIRMPDGIMAAYPVTFLQAAASPSRLLTLFDPLLPLSVLCKCLNAYAGIEEEPEDSALVKLSPMNMRRDTALIFQDLRLSASALFGSRLENTSKINGAGGASGHRPPSQGLQGYFRRAVAQLSLVLSLARLHWSQGPFCANAAADTVRKSVSEGGLKSRPLPCSKDSCKSQTCQNLSCTSETPLDPGLEPQPGFSLSNREHEATSSASNNHMTFPDGFQPLRSDQPAIHPLPKLSPILKNPFVSPLLAPDDMLKGLPLIHIVACALDPMLDESVMFARRLRALGQPVTLRVVQDLPHGFLSLSQLSRETRQAMAVCTECIRDILTSEAPAACQAPAAAASPQKHRKVERTFPAGPAPEMGQEGLNGAAAEGCAAPSPTDNAAPDPPEPQSTSPGDPSSGAGGGAVPTRSPSSEAAVTPSEDCSPSGGTVGRGVGA